MKRILPPVLGVIAAFCLMIILLFTAIEAVCYWTPGYFEKEYAKYRVNETVGMEMEDLLDVTDEMMAYLKGDRADLHVPTIVNGSPREFFNEREIAHMEDVRGLFLGAIKLRRALAVTAVICVVLMFLLGADVPRLLPRMICLGSAIFLVIAGAVVGLFATDFTRYFIKFHQIFFNNDLWILDPKTDLLINIVPEPFFYDTVMRFGAIYLGSILAIVILCLAVIRWLK